MRHYNGIRLVPPEMVTFVRAVLQNQGIDGSYVSSNGEIDPRAIIALGYTHLTVRTNATPDMVIDLRRNAPADPTQDQLMRSVQPTIIFKGPAGEYVIAPYGRSMGGDLTGVSIVGLSGVGAITLIGGLGFLAGVLLSRWRGR